MNDALISERKVNQAMNNSTIRTESFYIARAGEKDKRVYAVIWSPIKKPIMILQITHGMTEHIGRYKELAKELTKFGIAVAGFDLRGHGADIRASDIASFGQGDWESSIEDMHEFFCLLEERYSGIPHFMLGFSLGSFLLREYLGVHPKGVAGAIIMGTGHQASALLAVMSRIISQEVKKTDLYGTTELVKQLSFGTYNRKFRPNRTAADWLCSNEFQLDKYLEDPLCRKHISANLFLQLLNSMKRTGKKNSYDDWNKTMPILLISGEMDPVGNETKGVRSVYKTMKKANLSDVTIQFIPQARHDVLHDDLCGTASQLVRWMLLVNSFSKVNPIQKRKEE